MENHFLMLFQYGLQRFQCGRPYSNAESVSKSVDISGSFALGSMAVSSGTVVGVSREGESFLMEDSLCCPDYKNGNKQDMW